jgi:hypothetical protein
MYKHTAWMHAFPVAIGIADGAESSDKRTPSRRSVLEEPLRSDPFEAHRTVSSGRCLSSG